MVEGLPQAAVPPSVEVALHRGPRRKIFGEHPPLAPAGRDEQNGIHDRAQIDRAWPSARPCRRQQRHNDRPFPIRHVARIASANTPMILASDVIPGHSTPRLQIKDADSQPADIAQLLFGRALRARGCGAVGAWDGRRRGMAQRSLGRDRDNQCATPYLEYATLIWTRSANLYGAFSVKRFSSDFYLHLVRSESHDMAHL